MLTTLATSAPREWLDPLQTLAATRWWDHVPLTTVESLLTELNQTASAAPTVRANAVRKALGQVILLASKLLKEGEPSSRDPWLALAGFLGTLPDEAIPGLFETLFGRPLNRLAAYGSLRPGESNFDQVSMINGCWVDGKVKGRVWQPDEYLEFAWDVTAPAMEVRVLISSDLYEHIDRLDQFEGECYRRILVPVLIAESVSICHIYEGVRTDFRV
ncbi:gamma-glutamylcyclotransferase [Schlesneria sp. DSM 10557]|uniref:gamma-glutamylcyclotransferase n=1 Tax=Schlesneria sp. DSM 10557 TaxID=3044399 RepID=UPI0035A07BE5